MHMSHLVEKSREGLGKCIMFLLILHITNPEMHHNNVSE